MSVAFAPGPKLRQPTTNPQQIQRVNMLLLACPSNCLILQMLDENAHLIQIISDYQNRGRVQEAVEFKNILHRNLSYLAGPTARPFQQQPPPGQGYGQDSHGGHYTPSRGAQQMPGYGYEQGQSPFQGYPPNSGYGPSYGPGPGAPPAGPLAGPSQKPQPPPGQGYGQGGNGGHYPPPCQGYGQGGYGGHYPPPGQGYGQGGYGGHYTPPRGAQQMPSYGYEQGHPPFHGYPPQ